jgi:SAM-dependent methyltransferase
VRLWNSGVQVRARRALDRQLEYQRRKATQLQGSEQAVISWMLAHSREVRGMLNDVHPVPADARVLEVGCGAHGLIFFFGTQNGIGLDPLAHHYAKLFPAWQRRARTIAASGERLPFADGSFAVVLCDNVVDHAENPRLIIEEIARVLVPGGTIYFEVNIHHPFYHAAASVHAAWRALGIPFEISPFADHTVHLTLDAARTLFRGLPFRIVRESNDIEHVKRQTFADPIRHAGDRLKRIFFKNARYEVIAVREPVTFIGRATDPSG